MELMIPALYGFGLVLFRAVGLCITAPLFGLSSVPSTVRVGVAAGIAFAGSAAMGVPSVALPDHTLALAGQVVMQTMLGLTAGFAARVCLEAAMAAGQLASMSMGLGYGALLDPINGAESTAISQLLHLSALGVAVSAGIHREAIAWFCQSLSAAPVGAAFEWTMLCQSVVLQVIGSCALSVRLAFPLLVAITFGHGAMALMGRAAPQVNIASIGFSVTIVLGGGALYVLTPDLAAAAATSAIAAFRDV